MYNASYVSLLPRETCNELHLRLPTLRNTYDVRDKLAHGTTLIFIVPTNFHGHQRIRMCVFVCVTFF